MWRAFPPSGRRAWSNAPSRQGRRVGRFLSRSTQPVLPPTRRPKNSPSRSVRTNRPTDVADARSAAAALLFAVCASRLGARRQPVADHDPTTACSERRHHAGPRRRLRTMPRKRSGCAAQRSGAQRDALAGFTLLAVPDVRMRVRRERRESHLATKRRAEEPADATVGSIDVDALRPIASARNRCARCDACAAAASPTRDRRHLGRVRRRRDACGGRAWRPAPGQTDGCTRRASPFILRHAAGCPLRPALAARHFPIAAPPLPTEEVRARGEP